MAPLLSVYDRLDALWRLAWNNHNLEIVAIRLDRKSEYDLVRDGRRNDFGFGTDLGAGRSTWRNASIIVEPIYPEVTPVPLDAMGIPTETATVETWPTVISVECKIKASGRIVYYDDPHCDPRILETARFYAVEAERSARAKRVLGEALLGGLAGYVLGEKS